MIHNPEVECLVADFADAPSPVWLFPIVVFNGLTMESFDLFLMAIGAFVAGIKPDSREEHAGRQNGAIS